MVLALYRNQYSFNLRHSYIVSWPLSSVIPEQRRKPWERLCVTPKQQLKGSHLLPNGFEQRCLHVVILSPALQSSVRTHCSWSLDFQFRPSIWLWVEEGKASPILSPQGFRSCLFRDYSLLLFIMMPGVRIVSRDFPFYQALLVPNLSLLTPKNVSEAWGIANA